jgi:hypothetical protein
MNYFKRQKLMLITIALFFMSPLFSQSTDPVKSDHTAYNNFSTKTDSVSINNKSALIEQLTQLEFISGTVHFSGTNFHKVVTSTLKKNTGAVLSSFFAKCVTGSKITFEKCIIKGSDGKTRTLHKSIIIQ